MIVPLLITLMPWFSIEAPTTNGWVRVTTCDVNADGASDLWVGTVGLARLFLAGPTGMTEQPSLALSPTAAPWLACGDLDLDGLVDLVAGNDTSTDDDATRPAVYFDATTASPEVVEFYPAAMVGPQLIDVGAGTPSILYARTGSQGVVSIATFDSDRRLRTQGISSRDSVRTIEGYGNLEHDTRSDLLTVVQLYPTNRGFELRWYDTLLGPYDYHPTWTWRPGGDPNDPTQAAYLGDVNGDGFDDVGISGTTRAWWAPGGPSGPGTPLPLPEVTGACRDDVAPCKRGGRLEAIGDIDGDGYADVARSTASGVSVHLGSPTGLIPSPAAELPIPTSTPEPAERRVVAAGDINGDQLDDFVVGVSRAAVAGPAKVYVVLGRSFSDADGDGVANGLDCAPRDGQAYPGATEVVGNAVDEDCDGQLTCYLDADQDGVGGSSTVLGAVCLNGGARTGDCDDHNVAVHPDALLIPDNAVDENCDGLFECLLDLDDDGFGGAWDWTATPGQCTTQPRHSSVPGDCDDLSPDAFPGAPEEEVSPWDRDCDGLVACAVDADGDGYGSYLSGVVEGDLGCALPGLSPSGQDCDDHEANVHPGVEDIPGDIVDDDCDGWFACYQDQDGDGWGRVDQGPSFTTTSCATTAEMSAFPGDCYDWDALTFPGGPESPGSEQDNNCDGFIWCWPDTDGDRQGDDAAPPTPVPLRWDWIPGTCSQTGFSGNNTDCNDQNDEVALGIYPGSGYYSGFAAVTGLGDRVDNDCDGMLECWEDNDNDGFGSWYLPNMDFSEWGNVAGGCRTRGWAARGGDCNDHRRVANPSVAETSTTTWDDDCDGFNSCAIDIDGDGYAGEPVIFSSRSGSLDCPPTLKVAGQEYPISFGDPDCDDLRLDYHPGAADPAGDGADQNCDGSDGSHLVAQLAGGVNLTLSGASPQATVAFLASRAGLGAPSCPAQAGGACTQLASWTLLGVARANAAGDASLAHGLPPLPPRSTLWFQAIAISAGSGQASDVTTVVTP